MAAEKLEMCCLTSAVHDRPKKKILYNLDGLTEMTIGRSPECTVLLPSNMVQISRRHAILEKKDNKWTVLNNRSMNGVFINDQAIPPGEAVPLTDGDFVRLGTAVDDQPAFTFQFHTNLKVKPNKIRDRANMKGDVTSDVVTTKSGLSEAVSPSRGVKRSPSIPADSPVVDTSHKKQRIDDPDTPVSRELLNELQQQKEETERKLMEQLESLKEQLEKKNQTEEHLQQELKRRDEAMKRELEKQKCEMEAQLREAHAAELAEKERLLKQRLSDVIEGLQKEKKKVEEDLQIELARQLEEKDKDLQHRLEQEKERLDKVIEQKEVEHLTILHQLDTARCRQSQQHQDVLKEKENLLGQLSLLNQALENELQCSICNELFVQATSLNCSHSFCSACISSWMVLKKECPICRSKITSRNRSLVLDNYIDKVVEQLSFEMKDRRVALVLQRKVDEEERQRPGPSRRGGGTDGPSTSTPRPRTREASTRNANTGGASTRERPTYTQRTRNGIWEETDDGSLQYVEEEVVELAMDTTSSSDDDDDSSIHLSSSSDESDSWIDGVDGLYYRSGRCFTCNYRGHWSADCPYRHRRP